MRPLTASEAQIQVVVIGAGPSGLLAAGGWRATGWPGLWSVSRCRIARARVRLLPRA
jgi:threonine dehydrogenase-like Zn-dependent dehydrogenase